MINLKLAFRNAKRNKSKSILMILVSLSLVLFLMYYVFLLNSNIYRLNKVYDTTDVVVKFERKDGSGMKKSIPYYEVKQIEDKSGMVKKSYYRGDYTCSLKKNGITSFEDILKLIATSDISREAVVTEFSSDITYADGCDESIFYKSDKNICIVSDNLYYANDWKLGENIKIYAPNEGIMEHNIEEFILAGIYKPAAMANSGNKDMYKYANAVYCAVNPFSETAKKFYINKKYVRDDEFILTDAEYILANSKDVEKFKNYIKDKTGFYIESPINPLISKITPVIYDDELKNMIGPVQSIADFMRMALPAMFVLIGVIAFGMSYVMGQARINDIALMRAMGIKKNRIYLVIMSEMSILQILGAIIAFIACFTIYRLLFKIIPQTHVICLIICTYCITFFAGNTIALLVILRLKPIAVLTRKE